MERKIEDYLDITTCCSPSFSPDCSRIAYLSNETGTNQVWLMDIKTETTKQMTFFPNAVQKVSYSPVDDIFVFTMDQSGNEKYQIYMMNNHGHYQLVTDGTSVHFFGGWSPDGQYICYANNRRHPKHFDVYIQSIENSNKATMILGSNEYWTPLMWSPNGKSLLLMKRSEGTMNNDLFLYHLDGNELEHLTPHKGQSYHWSFDFHFGGDKLAIATDARRDHAELIWLDLNNHNQTTIASLDDAGIDLCRISPDGKYLLYGIRKDGQSILRLKNINTNEELPLPSLPLGYVWDASWSHDGKYIAIVIDGAQHPTNIWILDVKKTSWVRSLPHIASNVSPKLVHCTSFDHLQIPGWLYLPKNAAQDSTLTAIIHVHGGPENQARPVFDPIIQYFISKGIVVLAPNIRGSTGYGKRYTRLDDQRKRWDAVADLHACYEWLVKSKWANPQKVSIMGTSYGGFMVLAAMTTYPKDWSAGVAIAPISDLESYLENTSPHRRKFREAEYGSLDTDRDWLQQVSPIWHVDRIQAPLLLIHGKNDTRIPYQETERFFNKLRETSPNGNKLILLEDEGHEIRKKSNIIQIYNKISFFLKI